MWRTDSLWFETAIVLGIFAVGNILFGHFEQHRSSVRRLAKVALVLGITLTVSSTLGRVWGLGWLLLPLGAAAYIHLRWLPKHGINGWTGEPREKYLELVAARSRRGPADSAAKAPLLLTLLVMGLLLAVLLVSQPYSADWPGAGYTKPARSYLRAAIRQDSVGLVRRSASMAPVRWALDAARAHPDTFALWGRRIQAWIGEKRGDTTEVFVYPTGDVCGESPIVLRFIGTGRRAKVVRAHSACVDPG